MESRHIVYIHYLCLSIWHLVLWQLVTRLVALLGLLTLSHDKVVVTDSGSNYKNHYSWDDLLFIWRRKISRECQNCQTQQSVKSAYRSENDGRDGTSRQTTRLASFAMVAVSAFA